MKNDQAKTGGQGRQEQGGNQGSQPLHTPPKGNEKSNIGVDNEGKIRKEDRWNKTEQQQGKPMPDAKDTGTLNKRKPSMEEPTIDTPALSPDEPPRTDKNK